MKVLAVVGLLEHFVLLHLELAEHVLVELRRQEDLPVAGGIDVELVDEGEVHARTLARRPDALRAKPAWNEVQAARGAFRRSGRGLDDPAVAPHLRPGLEQKLARVMAGDEEVVTALLDEDEEDAIALGERVRARRQDAELDALDDGVAGD